MGELIMILDKIIESKRREVSVLREQAPLELLLEAASCMPPPCDFEAAIAGCHCAIIAEIKRKSPSRGVLREDFDPQKFSAIYGENGAAAISVLTDEPFFGGHRRDLFSVKMKTDIPVLRKDFIIDPYQIYEARAIGADAVLLIADILDEQELKSYIDLAESLGMHPLVEVHGRDELDKALGAGARIIGINNRNLKTFKTDLQTTLTLAPMIPKDRIVVSESGIHSREDVERLMEAGVFAFLVGETLMKAPDMGAKLRELLGR